MPQQPFVQKQPRPRFDEEPEPAPEPRQPRFDTEGMEFAPEPRTPSAGAFQALRPDPDFDAAVQRRIESIRGQELKPAEIPFGIRANAPMQSGEPGTPPRDQVERARAMPNYDKLTPFEKSLYGWLPGFAESTPGKILKWFGETWAGKALSYLDVLAEGLERTTGLGTQYADAWLKDIAAGTTSNMDDLNQNLQAAWYAGGLTADVANLPTWKRSEEGYVVDLGPLGKYKSAAGKVIGLTVPTDLPGMDGMVRARKDIAALIAQGVQPKEALAQVRDAYYNDLGALQLRAQLYDTWFHIGADPLNVLMGFIHPIERLKAARTIIEGAKIPQESIELLGKAAREAEKLGNVADAAKLRMLAETGKPLTRADKLVMMITGGDPLKPNWMAKTPILKAFTLAPQARAHELFTVVTDKVNSVVAQLDEPEQIARLITRAAEGAVGPEWGHAFLTLEGRTAQAALSGFDVAAKDIFGAYLNVQDEYTALRTFAEALGEHPDRLLATLVETDGRAIASRLVEKGIAANVDELKTLVGILQDTPYSPQLFKVNLMNAVADHAARQGVIQFGVKARGILEKLSLAMKSAETLAFLRLNPAYAIRNVVNNEMTMIARGLVGRVTGGNIEKFWTELVGFEPVRLSQGFGMVGEAVTAPAEVGSKVIYDALRGERGFLDNVQDFFGGVKLGKFDMGTFSANAERSASKRAFTLGYQEFWKKYGWRSGKGFDFARDVVEPGVFNAIESKSPGFFRSIEKGIGSAWNEKHIDDFTRGNLNLTLDAITEEASRRIGFDVDEALPTDFLAKHQAGLQEAAAKGPQVVKDYLGVVRNDLRNHLDELAKYTVDNVAFYTEQRIQAEGPVAFTRIYADHLDEWWGAHMAHASRMEMLGDVVRNVTDPKVSQDLWRKIFTQNDDYFVRAFDRMDGALTGMRKGANKLGLKVPEEVVGNFREIKKGWRDFFSFRNKELEAFFEARLKKKAPRLEWDALMTEIDDRYRDIIRLEELDMRLMDESVAKFLPDPDMTGSFISWRGRVAALRRADKEGVVAFRETLKGLSPDARREAYGKFWQERMKNWSELRDTDRAGLGMLSGDPQARAAFEELAAVEREANDLAFTAQEKVLRGEALTPEEVAARAEFINKYGRPEELFEMKQLPYPDVRSELKRLSGTTREKIDPTVSRLLEEEAYNMLAFVGEGQPGQRIFKEGQFSHALSSTYPDWYGEMAKKAGGKNAVIKALQKIIKDKGLDKGTTVARLKGIALETLADDPRVLIALGDEDSAFYNLSKLLERDADIFQMFGDDAEELYRFMGEYNPEAAQAAFEKLRTQRITGIETGVFGREGRRLAAPPAAGAPPFRISSDIDRAIIDEALDRLPPRIRNEIGNVIDEIKAGAVPSGEGGRFVTTAPGKGNVLLEASDLNNAETIAHEMVHGWILNGKDDAFFSEYARLRFPEETSKEFIASIAKRKGSPLDETFQEALTNDLNRYMFAPDELDVNLRTLFDERLTAPPVRVPSAAAGAPSERAFIPDLDHLQPPEPPLYVAEEQYWLNRGLPALDAVEDAAIAQAGKKPLKWAGFDKAETAEIERYLSHVKTQMSDIRYASVRFGEFRRDAALLNYNRRYNYNTYLGMLAPYEFWFTQSLMKWALHSIDRPAMLSTYLRVKKMLLTMGAPDQAIPSRVKGNIRVPLPFLPEWMGRALFVDPMRTLLPFDTFAYPYEQFLNQQQGEAGQAGRLLDNWVDGGQITRAEADAALAGQAGQLWEAALAQARQNNADQRHDAFDFMSMMTAPHAPLVWAKEILEGSPEDIGPFTPLTRMSRGVEGLLGISKNPVLRGIGAVAGVPYHIEAKVRTWLGLPAFDQWDDYRIDRMLSNMAATGEITTDQALRAMIDRDGEAFEEARQKAEAEFGVGAMGSITGIPIKAYPEGEFLQRSLKDDYERAWKGYEAGNDGALNKFYERHPEYEARLALFKTPEERLKNFLVDNLWSKWNDFNKFNRREISDQLGTDFQEWFLDKETRNYDSIPLEQMQIWLKMMGGDPPGSLNSPVPRLELTDPDMAYRAQAFYDARREMFPNYFDLQDTYFKISEKNKEARRKFLRDNPELKTYWDWRRDFMHRNPDVVPLLTDDFTFEYESAEAVRAAQEGQPAFISQEWQIILGRPAYNLILDYMLYGKELPESVYTLIGDVSEQYNIPVGTMFQQIENSVQP